MPERLLKKTLCALSIGTLLLLLGSGQAWAGGVSFTEQGAAASGKGNAFTGEANDPSAIFYNPAGITQLPGTQFMIGTSIVKLDSTFRSSTSSPTGSNSGTSGSASGWGSIRRSASSWTGRTTGRAASIPPTRASGSPSIIPPWHTK